MGSRQGCHDGIPPEIAANFRELFPEHEHLEEFLMDQESVYQSLQGIPKHNKDLAPNSNSQHNSSSRNQSVDASSISRTDSMNSDVDVALTLSMLELDAHIEQHNASMSESSQSTAGNRGSRSTDTTVRAVEFDDLDPDNMTYEELQSLGDAIGVESRGLSKKVLLRLPTRKFKEKSSWFSSKTKSQSHPQECVICSEEYANGDLMTILQCKHRYHKECIGKWFSNHKTCPICKTEVS